MLRITFFFVKLVHLIRILYYTEVGMQTLNLPVTPKSKQLISIAITPLLLFTPDAILFMRQCVVS